MLEASTMKSRLTVLVMVVAVLGVWQANAIPLGTQITIPDGLSSSKFPWWSGGEDNEGEPGAYTGNQTWDLEGVFISGNRLTTVGGYSFRNYTSYSVGAGSLVGDRAPGDIFIDLNGDAGSSVLPAYGYDYVLDLDFNSLTYSVYQLTDASKILMPRVVKASGPWLYDGGGTLINGYDHVAMSLYQDFLLDSDVAGLKGTYSPGSPAAYMYHSAFAVDLDFLSPGQEFIYHFTMGCGNDLLVAEGRTVPEAVSTCGLLALGVVALALARRAVKSA